MKPKVNIMIAFALAIVFATAASHVIAAGDGSGTVYTGDVIQRSESTRLNSSHT